MANGLVVADTGISVGGRAVLGANLARIAVNRLTHTSDTALIAQGSGGSAMATWSSAIIPTAGWIRVTVVQIEWDETEGSTEGAVAYGIKVGSDGIIWQAADDRNGTLIYGPHNQTVASAASVISRYGLHTFGNANIQPGGTFILDIAGNSVTTGTKNIVLYMADNVNSFGGEITVTGSTLTAVFLVEIIDGT